MINDSNKRIVYLFGENGSGKTTYIRKWVEDNKNNYKLSYLSQTVINSLSNILLNVQEYFDSVSYYTNTDENKLKDLIKYFNIEHLLNKQTTKMSGGEKQIISLVYQLSKKSDLYILDEPFNNLDLKKIKLVNDYIENSSQRFIIVSHHLDFIINDSQLFKFENFKYNEVSRGDIHEHY